MAGGSAASESEGNALDDDADDEEGWITGVVALAAELGGGGARDLQS